MSQTLTYVIGQDRRPHVDNVQDFKVNFDGSNTNWVQARQYERSMRQVFVNIKNEDGTPLDLTGCNVWFEGLLPKNSAGDFRVIDDKGYVALDPTAGRFRFDMPGHAFTVAGSYRQAFFRILKDGNSITTLEFDLDVLADKVIDGLVPRTYISPFEDLYDQLVKILDNADGKLQDKLTEWNNKLQDLFNSLNKMGIETQTLLQTLQGRITTLEEKIKQDGLFTQAEADVFKQDMQKTFDGFNEQFESTKKDIEAIRQMGRNNAGLLQYKMVTVTTDPNGRNSVVTENQIKHLQAIHATMSIVDMVGITDKNDSNPQKSDGKLLQQAIAWSKQYNVPITMIKPHLGIDYWDNFYQADYMPTDVAGYFNAWGAILMKYAAICDENNIPILCLEVEQYLMTQNKYLDYWRTIIDNIRAKYPHLLLTAAYMSFEIVDDEHADLLKYLDLIGMNMYPGYIIDDYSDKLTTSYLIQSFSNTIAGINNTKCIDQACEKFHKNAILTETGCIPTVKGLTQLVPDDFNSVHGANDYEVTAFLMKAMFNFLKEDKNIIGFAWWHAGKPFNFFNETEDVANLSPAENVFKSSIEGGVI